MRHVLFRTDPERQAAFITHERELKPMQSSSTLIPDSASALSPSGIAASLDAVTLADLVRVIETDGLDYEPTSRESALRALRRHARVLGRRLDTISADPGALREDASRIAWAAHGFSSAKAFRLHCAKVFGPAKRLAARITGAMPPTGHTEAWRCVAKAVADLPLSADEAIMIRARWASLSRMAERLEIASPADLDEATVLEIAETQFGKLRQRWRDNIVALNKLVAMRGEHDALAVLPVAPLPLPPPGKPRQLIDWQLLPEPLRTEVDEILGCLASGRSTPAPEIGEITLVDVVLSPEAAAFKPQKPRSIELTRAAIVWAVTGQILGRGRNASELTSLAPLCTPLVVAQAAEAQAKRQKATGAYNPRSSGPYQLASILYRIASRFYRIDPPTHDQWKRLLKALRLDRDVGKMATKHRELLDQLIKSTRMQRAWLTIDQRAWKIAEDLRKRGDLTRAQRRDVVHIANFAVLMTILIRTLPTRLSTLPAITFRGEKPLLQLPRTRGDRAFLDLPAVSVKNGRRMLVDVPPESLEIISAYIQHYRPLALAQPLIARTMREKGVTDSDYLIPGMTGDGHRSRSSLAALIKRGLRAFGFKGVTTHVVRHFMAQLLLEADPNAIGVAADWLGDERRTVEAHYRVSNAAPAAKRSRAILFGGDDV